MHFQSFAFVRLSAVLAFSFLTLCSGCVDRRSSDRDSSGSNAGGTTSSSPRQTEGAPALPASATKSQPSGGNAHSTGTHGGTIVPIGADSFHAEVVIDQDGTLRMLMLGRDETHIQEVEIQQLKSFVKAPGAAAQAVDLVAAPHEEDTEGRTSQFTGQLPESFIGKPLEVTIPSVKIQGERFRVGFTTGNQRQMNRRERGDTQRRN